MKRDVVTDPDIVRGNAKLVELEALRGFAAIIVLVHHSLLAFYPQFHGLVDEGRGFSLFGTPLFALINGSAAVILFFVLSGFVLTMKAFGQQSCSPLRNTAVKRWPRLVFPVLVVNIASGCLAGWGYYSNASVAGAVQSQWLGWFFNKPAMGVETVLQAAYEGAVLTFLTGSQYFNSSLWTMKYEFLGSFLCIAVAATLISWRKYSWFSFGLVASLVLAFLSPLYLSFLAGVGLAAFYASDAWRAVPAWLSGRSLPFWALTAAILVLLFGYHEPLLSADRSFGFYAALAPLAKADALLVRVALHTVASVILIMCALAAPSFTAFLSGRLGAWLGRISFPVYLVQVPVICSVACAAFTQSLPLGSGFASAIGFAVAVGGSLLVAVPLMWAEAGWLAMLKKRMSGRGQPFGVGPA